MKKSIFWLLAMVSANSYAQQNTLLENSFWQANPDLTTVKSAISSGNSPSQLNRASFDPVVLAINNGATLNVVKYLIEQEGNSVAKLTHDARTYLHWAASKGNDEIVAFLLEKGAAANLKDSHGSTPLNFAANAGQQNTKVYDLLLQKGASLKKDLTENGANALLLAIASDKDFKLTDYFVSKGLDLKSTDANGNNAFSYAAKTGNINLLKKLLDKGVQKNDQAIILATEGGRRGSTNALKLDFLEYLESIGIDPKTTSKAGKNALHNLASRSAQADLIQYFLDKDVNVAQADEEGNTALLNAAATNPEIKIMDMLLNKANNVNQGNKKGVTPLMLAVKGNSPDVVAHLIAKGADLSASDNEGNGLAHYWIQSYPTARGDKNTQDFEKKASLLVQKGLDLSLPQKNGNTLYHLAVAKGDIALLKRISEMDIDINAKNNDGLTALHKACLVAKNDELMKFLIAHGASREIKTNFGETAFDLASENETLSKIKTNIDFLK